jgi:hypothetical protein
VGWGDGGGRGKEWAEGKGVITDREPDVDWAAVEGGRSCGTEVFMQNAKKSRCESR